MCVLFLALSRSLFSLHAPRYRTEKEFYDRNIYRTFAMRCWGER